MHKFKQLGTTIKRNVYKIIDYFIRALAFLFCLPSYSRCFRKSAFYLAKRNSLLLTSRGKDFFIVSTNDQIIGKAVYLDNHFEGQKLDKVMDLLKIKNEQSLLFDIGANIGTVCIPAIKRGLFQKAFAVEPEPLNFNLLSANIFINNLADQIQTLNCALGANDDKELILELSPTNFGDHRIRTPDANLQDVEANRELICIKSNSFDTTFKNQSMESKKTLLWMDVQGYEGFVLQGASSVLNEPIPLVLEFWPYGMLRCGSYGPLKEALLNSNHMVFYNLGNKIMTAYPLTNESLDALWQSLGTDTESHTDILVVAEQ